METVQPIKNKKQLEAVKNELRSKSLRDYSLFVLGINCGLRVSDMVQLTIGDIFDGAGVRRKLVVADQEYELGQTVRLALEEYLETREQPLSTEEPLFISRKKKGGEVAAVQRDIVYKAFNAAARAAGLTERIGTITMRKTFGYFAIQAGVPLKRVQKALNQPSVSSLLKYLDLKEEEIGKIGSLNL